MQSHEWTFLLVMGGGGGREGVVVVVLENLENPFPRHAISSGQEIVLPAYFLYSGWTFKGLTLSNKSLGRINRVTIILFLA